MELYIGLMSGTSLDAMDGVLVDYSANTPKLLADARTNYTREFKIRLAKFNYEAGSSLADIGLLEKELAELAHKTVEELLRKSKLSASDVKAVAFPGQTLAHNPADSFTFQCGDANILAEMSSIPVVADFRRRDLAAGGQGAPLATSFHHAFFSSPTEKRIILNLGGIANVTILEEGKEPLGFDTGPANCLLDEWAQANEKGEYDDKGAWAASGTIIDDLLCLFLEDKYFSMSPPKTTGRDYFNLDWIKDCLRRLGGKSSPRDVQACLTDLTALSISLAIQPGLEPGSQSVLYASGGGTGNSYLMERIAYLSKLPLKRIESLGFQSHLLEAVAFSWLAYLRMNNRTGNLPSVTGARGPRLLGGVYS